MPRNDPTHPAPPSSGNAAPEKHPDSVLRSIGKAIFAPIEGAHDGVVLPHGVRAEPHHEPPKQRHPEDEHHPRMLSSIGKAMLAPLEGSHGGLSGMSRHRPAPAHPAEPAPATDPEGRDPRVVGKKSDNVLESIGKAVVAPVEGADEGADKPGSLPPAKTPK